MEKSFFIKTLGCKTNQIESQIIKESLLKMGYLEEKSEKKADIYVMNSCSVTSHTDSSVMYLINKVKRENPDVKVVLTGCAAQTINEAKNFDLQNIDLILGNNEKLEIEKYIKALFEKDFAQTKKVVSNIFEITEFNNKEVFDPYQTRPSIKIQEGCNNRCSYCLIPFARGNSRSNPIENIIKQIEILVENNRREVVLTGIHIGQWGLEFNKSLYDLLIEIEKTPINRVRLGSLYVNEIDDKLLEFLKESKKFCPHFHLSLQSLCDKTLRQMNRNYDAKTALDMIEKIYNSFDEPFLGCDIIAGFPNETDEDFEITYNNLKSAPLSQIHAFPYSLREGTVASNMENQVQNSVKTERTERLLSLSYEKHAAFLNRNKNKNLEFLFERKSPKTGKYSLISRNYIKVYVDDKNDDLRGTIKTFNTSEFEALY